MKKLVAAAIAAALVVSVPAFAQTGAHAHDDIDARIDSLSTAVGALKASQDDLALRVKALEDGGAAPEPAPVPDPEPTPVPDPEPAPPPAPDPAPSPGGNVLSVDAAQAFQTINGWSVTTRAWEQDKLNDRYDPTARENAPEIVSRLINDAGVNRVRLEIQTGSENPRDFWAEFTSGALTYNGFKAKYYEAVNDNADPFTANPAGFHWSALDEKVESLILPMRSALAARGEKLWINLNVVDFGGGDAGNLEHSDAPEEYAEFVLEALKHLKSAYGLTPDSLEVILEPDIDGVWPASEVAAAIKAVRARMTAAGFSMQIIGPSTSRVETAIPYLDAIRAAGESVDAFSYHTYGPFDDAALAAIGAKGAAAGVRTEMLEKIGAGIDLFYRNMTIDNASAWLQWGAAAKTDNGNNLLVADLTQSAGARLSLASRTRALAQVWRHVRRGYVRVGAGTNFTGVRALAFRAPDGGMVAVGIAARAKDFAITGLPAGSYAVEYTTAAELSRKAGTFAVAPGEALAVSIPAEGVLVAYPVGSAAPPPSPVPTPTPQPTPTPTPNPTPLPGPVGYFPNIDDGKTIIQLGIEKWTRAWGSVARIKNKWDLIGNLRMFAPGVRDPYSTAKKTPGQRIELGELDTWTGWQWLDAGDRGSGDETFLFEPRIWQSKGQAEIQTGKWIYVIDVKSADSFQPNLIGWTESGSVANFGTAQSAFVNGGAPFSFDRLRFEIDHTAQDTFLGPYTARAINGAWFRVHYAGRDSDYATFETQPWTGEHLANAAKYKVWRFMDPICTNDAKYVKADDMIRPGADYLAHGCGTSWTGKLAANDQYRIGGFSLTYAMKGALAANSTLQWNVPNTFGFGVLDDDLTNGIFSQNFRRAYGSIELQAAIDAHLPRIEEMKAEARAEYAKLFDRMLDEMLAIGWEDDRALILEESNEMWGIQFTTQNRANYIIEEYLFRRSIGGNVPRHGNSTLGMGGGGYWGNLMLTEWKAAVARKKPKQAWVFGVGAKINDSSQNSINAYFNGWKLYSSDYPGASTPISELTVWHTDYLSDGLKYTRPGVGANMFDAQDETTWNQMFLALYASGGEQAVFDHGRDYLLSETAALSSATVTATLKKIDLLKAAISAVGAQYGGAYEGSDHNNENKQVSNALKPDPDGRIQTQFDDVYGAGSFDALRRNWVKSAQAEEVFKTYFAARLSNDPASQISNYEEVMAGPQNFESWHEVTIGEFTAPATAPASGIGKAYHDISRQGAFRLGNPQ